MKNAGKDYVQLLGEFGGGVMDDLLPITQLNEDAMPANIAYRMVKDELLDEGTARQNLATFCQTSMEPEAVMLMSETLEKNAIDKSEYPQTAIVEKRCIDIIANLWNAQEGEEYIGTSTVGSSEACMLAGMAMKFRWRANAEKEGLDIRARKPNLIISSGYQVCWEKFCVYWDIELRTVPVDADHLKLNLDTVMDYVDEYTMGIVGIQGSTYTGNFDDIFALNDIVEEYNKTTQFKVYIHVDGASGGLFTPFVDPELIWDFRLKNVISINTSGHKYGLVYPGIGWVLWRDKKFLPKELVFEVSYLGGEMPTMGINFSRSASQIIGQYYNFVRLGFKGYQVLHEKTRKIAMHIANELSELEIFEFLSMGEEMPVLCWKLKEDAGRKWDLYDLADRVRMHGWQVPTYPLSDNLSDTVVQRAVIRADFTRQLAKVFVRDLKLSVEELNEAKIIASGEEHPKVKYGFTH